MCSFRRAALAVCATLACAGIAPPAAGASVQGALTATFSAADGQPVKGMMHMYPNGTSHPRASLRVVLTGLPPRASVSIGRYSERCGEDAQIWAGTADADGWVEVGIERPHQTNSLDLQVDVLGFTYREADGDWSDTVCAPVQRVRSVRPGTRPDVLLATLRGTSGDGQKHYGLLHYDNGDPGPAVVSYITRVSACEPALYRFSIVGPSSLKNFMDYTDDACMHSAFGREILVDDTTWDVVARKDTDIVLSRIVDGEAMPLASTQGVRIGKLLGVNG